MPELLCIGTIATSGDGLVVSYSSDTEHWCITDISQASAAASSLAVLGQDLWIAFRGKTSTTIYVASLSDWGGNKPVGQSSNLAPALAAFNGKLWVAYVGEATGHVELVYSSDGIHWSAKFDTGMSSKLAPALTVHNDELWVAYIGETADHIELLSSADGTNWGGHTDTGQSSKHTPALVGFGPQLWVAYIGEAAGHVELVPTSLSLNQAPNTTSWAPKIDTGWASKCAPGLTVFEDELWVAFVGEATGQVELISSADGHTWSPSTNTGLATQDAPALVTLTVPEPVSHLGGNNQYVISGPAPENGLYTALKGLVVEIKITESIVVSPTSGLSSTNTVPNPIGFQINCFSPNLAKFKETSTSALQNNQAVGWQQYGVRMIHGSNSLKAFAESWPPGYETNHSLPNVFQYGIKNDVLLPNDLTIPAGWTIHIVFQHQSDGTVQGFRCSVTDHTGAAVGTEMKIDLLADNVPLAAGGLVSQTDLAPIVAFQVVLVGDWASAHSILTSGAGQITCSATTQMTPGNSWPKDADGNLGTGEWTNSIYGLIPSQSSLSIAQYFGVSNPTITGITGSSDFIVSGSGFLPNDQLTVTYGLLGGGSDVSETATASCVTDDDGTFTCTVQPANYPGPAFVPGTVIVFGVTARDSKGAYAEATCQVDSTGRITDFQKGQSSPG